MPTLNPKPKRRSSRKKSATKVSRAGNPKRRPATDNLFEEFVEQGLEQVRMLESLDLPETDGVPLESCWHRECINLLIESIKVHFQGRSDFSVGGNLCMYYSIKQVLNGEFLGPDFFFVHGEPQSRSRERWAVWEQDGHYPDVIIELPSPKTARRDRTEKKEIYRSVFHTSEYFLYDPRKKKLEGFRLLRNKYEPIEPDSQGRMWSEELELWIGTWNGVFQEVQEVWLRFFDPKGRVVPIAAELEKSRAEDSASKAEQEKSRADLAESRASTAEAEVARLKALLAKTSSGRTSPQ